MGLGQGKRQGEKGETMWNEGVGVWNAPQFCQREGGTTQAKQNSEVKKGEEMTNER